MDLKPTQIARQIFPMVSHGFDPQEVGPYLEALAERMHRLETDLGKANAMVGRLQAQVAEAARNEEALTLTMQAATQERADMLAAARQEAGQMLRSAKAEAERVEAAAADMRERAASEAAETRQAAAHEARSLVQEARSEALHVIEESRQAAGEVAEASHREELTVRARIEELRTRLEAIAGPLQALSTTAEAVTRARDTLPEPVHPQPSRPPAAIDVRPSSGLTADDFDVVHRPRDAVAVSLGAATLSVAQLEYIDELVTELGGEEAVSPVVEEIQREILGVSSQVASSEDRRRYLDALRQIN